MLLTPRQIYERLCQKDPIYAVSFFDLTFFGLEIIVIDSSNVEEVLYFDELDFCDTTLIDGATPSDSYHFYNFRQAIHSNVEVAFSKRKHAQYFVELLKKFIIRLDKTYVGHEETEANEEIYDNLRKNKIKKAILQYCKHAH